MEVCDSQHSAPLYVARLRPTAPRPAGSLHFAFQTAPVPGLGGRARWGDRSCWPPGAIAGQTSGHILGTHLIPRSAHPGQNAFTGSPHGP
jgi:hypothetical protein